MLYIILLLILTISLAILLYDVLSGRLKRRHAERADLLNELNNLKENKQAMVQRMRGLVKYLQKLLRFMN